MIVATIAIVVFVAAGAWASLVLPYPFLVSAGASVGLGVGALCAFLLVHPTHHTHGARAVEPARRRPLH